MGMGGVRVVGEGERGGEGRKLDERFDVVGHLGDLAVALGGGRGDAVVLLRWKKLASEDKESEKRGRTKRATPACVLRAVASKAVVQAWSRST